MARGPHILVAAGLKVNPKSHVRAAGPRVQEWAELIGSHSTLSGCWGWSFLVLAAREFLGEVGDSCLRLKGGTPAD